MLKIEDIQAHASDEALAAALAAGDDFVAAARLSQLLTEVVPVPINVLAAWAAQTGVRAAVQDAADTVGHPLRSVALAAIDLLQGGMSATFDTVVYGGMLDAMQSGGLMTQAHRDALTALATKPMNVSAADVLRVVRG